MKKSISELKKACKTFSNHIIVVSTITNGIVKVLDRSQFNGCIRDLINDAHMIYITGGKHED